VRTPGPPGIDGTTGTGSGPSPPAWNRSSRGRSPAGQGGSSRRERRWRRCLDMPLRKPRQRSAAPPARARLGNAAPCATQAARVSHVRSGRSSGAYRLAGEGRFASFSPDAARSQTPRRLTSGRRPNCPPSATVSRRRSRSSYLLRRSTWRSRRKSGWYPGRKPLPEVSGASRSRRARRPPPGEVLRVAVVAERR
jgi:hypothetical protein